MPFRYRYRHKNRNRYRNRKCHRDRYRNGAFITVTLWRQVDTDSDSEQVIPVANAFFFSLSALVADRPQKLTKKDEILAAWPKYRPIWEDDRKAIIGSMIGNHNVTNALVGMGNSSIASIDFVTPIRVVNYILNRFVLIVITIGTPYRPDQAPRF